MLEQLESRRLLATNFANGVLTITGTSGNDFIDLYTKPTTGNFDDPHVFVVVNNVAEGDFDWHAITLIRINALGGNDSVDLHRGGGVTGGRDTGKSAHVEGGAGSDTLIGSAGLDTLVGGSHGDVLVGNGGDDLLSGGAGNDKLSNVEGVNTVYDGGDTLGGGDGNDTLFGGGGSDLFQGGRGIDTVDYSVRTDNLLIVLGAIKLPDLWPVGSNQFPTGGDPIGYTAQPYPDFDPRTLGGTGWLEGDSISEDVENAFGGSGNDVIWGSNGDNILEGRAGNDQLYGSGGFDALYGNDGNDRLFAADDRDGMPTIVPPEPRHERIVGGLGRDYAMLDPTDAAWTSKVENTESLPYLYW